MCDLAQFYHIFDWRALPPDKIAMFAVGLPEDSRVKIYMSKAKRSLTHILLSLILDGINILIWQNTKDGTKGRNKPKSVLEELTDSDKNTQKELKRFDTAEEYEKWRKSKMR